MVVDGVESRRNIKGADTVDDKRQKHASSVYREVRRVIDPGHE